jgi:hypothetical protein
VKWKTKAPERSQNALAWLTETFGPYPYPQLTIAQGIAGNGVEYPMLVMSHGIGEIGILHGIGLVYFYGVLANNEQTEAWLDEGLTTFQTKWYMEKRYGRLGYDKKELLKNLPFFVKFYELPSIKQLVNNAAQMYMSSGHDEPISKPAHEFRDLSGYGMNSYLKGMLFFEMLRFVVGDSTFTVICREYYDRWKFKHVNEARFRAVCEKVSGQNLGWFFEQWLHDTPTIDYGLGKKEIRRDEDGNWETEIEIHKKGTGVMPVEVMLVGNPGDTLYHRWDGRGENQRLAIRTPFKPKKVVLDPNDAILDNNLLDNGASRFEWKFDLPLQGAFYVPREAYLLLWRPSIGYNDPDGWRLGGQITGSYKAIYRNFKVAAYAGLRSKEIDGVVSWANPLNGQKNTSRYALLFRKLEGRVEANAEIQFVLSRRLTRPPFHRFTIGINHIHLLAEEYGILRVQQNETHVQFQQWEKGNLNRLFGRYAIDPRGLRWQSNLAIDFSFATKALGGDFSYNKAQVEVDFAREFGFLAFHTRGFAGTILGDASPPLQDLFYIEGGSPLQRWRANVSRTKGDNLGGALYLIGGGAVRGYHNQPMAGKAIIAGSVELRARVPRIPYQFAAFFDKGQITLDEGSTLQRSSAGVSLVMDARAYGILPIFNTRFQLRFDFPLWLSHSLPGEDKWKYRWALGMRMGE